MRGAWIAGLGAALALATAAAFFFVLPPLVDARMNRVAAPPADAPTAVSADARARHARLTIADLHSDLLLWSRDPLRRYGRGHTDLPRLRDGNVALQVFSVVTKVPAGQNYERNTGDRDLLRWLALAQRWPPPTWRSPRARALHQAARLRDAAARSGGGLVLVTSVAELDTVLARRARGERVVGAVLALEGLHALEGAAASVDALFDAGFRMLGLAHFFDNEAAGSAHGVEKYGLTPLGRAVVQRMEERGMVLDLAHASPRAVDDALALATRPVVVSHTGVQATCPGPRNLTDAHVLAVARTGGVVGIGFWDGAVCGVGVEPIVRAIRHVADLAGAEHVALGSDFDGATVTPFDAAGLVRLTAALRADGFTDDEIAGIMGGNVIRVLRAILPALPPTAPPAAARAAGFHAGAGSAVSPGDEGARQ